MDKETDAQLLRQYVGEGSQDAFATLVDRHLGLVYGAAFRRTGGDAHAAMDVAQSVFVALAREAPRLGEEHVLPAWLYRVTRNAAIDFARAEARRRERELRAMEIQDANEAGQGGNDWERIRPLLDAAMDELPERDRTAVLLRFFAAKSYADIAAELDLTDDSARKRVDRSLEKLRRSFSRRGVRPTSAVLGELLAAHSALAAPSGAAARIAVMAVGNAGVVAGSAAAIGIMSTTKFTLAGLAFALAGALVLSSQAERIRELRERSMAAAPGGVALARAAPADNGATQVSGGPARALLEERDLWIGRLEGVQALLRAKPELWIPELEVLGERDWLLAALDAKLETDQEQRIFLARMRALAKNRFAPVGQQGFLKFVADHAGQLPEAMTDVAPYLAPPYNASAILARYRILKSGNIADVPNVPPGLPADLVAEATEPVDVEYDSTVSWSKSGVSGRKIGRTATAYLEAVAGFARENGGAKATSLDQLAPYLPQAGLDQKRLEEIFTAGGIWSW